jgi:hypothetical protein
MKVDMNIVPVKVKKGFFSSKDMHEARVRITLSDPEKAIINKYGLREFVLMKAKHEIYDVDIIVRIFADNTLQKEYAYRQYDTLAEAQETLAEIKSNLIRLKSAMDNAENAGTEDSFEL